MFAIARCPARRMMKSTRSILWLRCCITLVFLSPQLAFATAAGPNTSVDTLRRDGDPPFSGASLVATWRSAEGQWTLPTNATLTSVVFGGTVGSTRVAGAATLDVTADMSIEAWAKPTVVDTSSRTVVGKGAGDNAGTRQYRLGMTATDGVPHWRASVYIGGQAYVVDSTTVPLPDTWYHLALVRRGGRLTLFVNGAVEGRNSYLPARSVLNVMLGEPRVGR